MLSLLLSIKYVFTQLTLTYSESCKRALFLEFEKG